MKFDPRFVAACGVMAVGAMAMAAGTPPIVNFESVPSDEPAWEGAVIGDQYWVSAGVRFSDLEPGHKLVLAQVGAPMKAFVGFGGQADTPFPGAAVGNFFMTDDHAGTSMTAGPFMVEFAYPVNKFSATVLDVDCQESWRADAFDDQWQPRGSAQIFPTTVDGSAYSFSIEVSAPVITRVLITYTGTCAQPVTFAFDNISGSSPDCAVDLNGDGLVDFSDYLAFLSKYEQHDPSVDFNGDGLIDFADYLEFLSQYAAGC